jgi:shikimate dehydrogenase
VKTFALLGHPVGHSLSPALHHAAYRELGLDHRYITIDCPDEAAVRAQRQALVRGELSGVNITVPHKRLALALADSVHPSAARTGAANVWVREESGKVVAHNTDAGALADRLRAGLRPVPGAAPAALVLGSGGAARAAVVACLDIGAGPVRVSSRRWSGDPRGWEQASAFADLGAVPIAWSGPAASLPTLVDAARESLLVIQATSAGMLGVGGGEQVSSIIPWSRLPASAFVYDVVYNPARTPFLDAAREHQLRQEGGLSMLVGQAALAIELWLGVEPSRERMREAADRAIFGAHQ